ncbi:MAG: dUTP diphosphatase [Gammaproteobacteria bacterium]|nr:dUTP diphosphatase [Gammaproteobacteria bacterium]|tara:strand:- start:344 stop:799 length:456 start_codon:yes stop_codon:yes gene_type:complete
MQELEVKILNNKIGTEIPVPAYSTEGAAGMDLRACISQEITLAPGKTELIGTGIAISIKNPDYAALILPRSGLGHRHGIVLGNLVGLIDSDYQGEIMISAWNRGESSFLISQGDRIAQLVLIPVKQVALKIVTQFTTSERGDKGFGSSGLK